MRSPKIVLKDQADNLDNKTGGILKGELISAETESEKIPTLSNFPLKHSFYIVAPRLNDYKFELLSITHDKLKIYPIKLTNSINSESYDINSEDELIEKLTCIFNNKDILEILNSLIKQS